MTSSGSGWFWKGNLTMPAFFFKGVSSFWWLGNHVPECFHGIRLWSKGCEKSPFPENDTDNYFLNPYFLGILSGLQKAEPKVLGETGSLDDRALGQPVHFHCGREGHMMGSNSGPCYLCAGGTMKHVASARSHPLWTARPWNTGGSLPACHCLTRVDHHIQEARTASTYSASPFTRFQSLLCSWVNPVFLPQLGLCFSIWSSGWQTEE